MASKFTLETGATVTVKRGEFKGCKATIRGPGYGRDYHGGRSVGYRYYICGVHVTESVTRMASIRATEIE